MIVKAVVFDLGGVIVSYDWNIAIKRISSYACAGREEIVSFFTDFKNDAPLVEGKIGPYDFFLKAKKSLGLKVSFGRFSEIYSGIFSEINGMSDIVRCVKKNFPIYILSNTNPFHFPYILKKYGNTLNMFDGYFLSYEMFCQKPGRKIYLKMLDMLNFQPDEVVFIDDTENNISAAVDIGIKAVLFENVGKLREILQDMGVICCD